MKKAMLIVLSIMFMGGTSFAAVAELSFTGGLPFSSSLDSNRGFPGTQEDAYPDVVPAPNIGAQFFYSVSRITSFGIGAKYLFPRDINAFKTNVSANFAPMYISVMFAPAPTQSNFYFQGNLGQVYMTDIEFSDNYWSGDKSSRGGVYYGFAGGYNISDSLFLELFYDVYGVRVRYESIDYNWTIQSYGINVGYKLNLGTTRTQRRAQLNAQAARTAAQPRAAADNSGPSLPMTNAELRNIVNRR
jgi:hypothetical protein